MIHPGEYWLEPLRQSTERIRQETEDIRKESEGIRRETERIRQEAENLRQQNAALEKINHEKLKQIVEASLTKPITMKDTESPTTRS